MIAYERVVDAFRENGLIVNEKSKGVATAQAPGHSPADRSVSIWAIAGGVLLNSHADDKQDVMDALGLNMSDLYDSPSGAKYEYGDGRVVHRTPDKKFHQSGNKKGQYLFRTNLKSDVVWMVEGEKDVLTLESVGAVATCTAMGAGKAHLFDLTPLYGKTVMVVRDMDEAGDKHARQIMELLDGHAETVLVQPAWGKDASDHIGIGRTLDEFVRVLPPRPEGPRSLSEAAQDWWDWLDAPPSDVRVFPFPWDHANEVMAGGMHPKRVYVIAGRPGGGKTLAMLNIAAHIAEEQYPTLMFSLEMPELEAVSRIMSWGSGANYGRITRRQVDDRDRHLLALFDEGRVHDSKLYIMDEPTMTIEDICSVSRQMKQSDAGLDVVMIDYIGRIKSSRGFENNRREGLGHIMKRASDLAKELNVSVMIASQLNRGPEQANTAPKPSDLRESGDIEQDADAVLMLHHETIEGMPSGEVQLIVGKNRMGPQPVVVTLPWRPNVARIG